jgi:hypothetical protein
MAGFRVVGFSNPCLPTLAPTAKDVLVCHRICVGFRKQKSPPVGGLEGKAGAKTPLVDQGLDQ